MSSLEDSDYDMDQQIPGAARVPGVDKAHDLGSREMTDSRGLKQLIQSNLEQAGSFIGHINFAKANAQKSVDNLEQKYEKMAEELEQKVEQQHQEQVERLKADQVRLSGWLRQYVADLKAAKQLVKFDALQELVDDVNKFRDGQEKLQEEIYELISAEALQRDFFGQEVEVQAVTVVKNAET